jgi:Flp pilus assembly protein CpaB
MKTGGGGKVLMMLGVVLALISGGVVFVIASTATAGPKETPMTAIVVAANEIPERAIITDALLTTVEVPTASIPPGAVLKKEDLIDKFAKDKLYPKTPIQLTQIAARRPGEIPAVQPTQPPATGSTTKTPVLDVTASYSLEKGRTMVAVDYPEASKLIVAGILRPKDRVDIYVRAPGIGGEQLALIFSNKEIHAIGDLKQTESAAPSPTLLFIDTPQNALVFKFIEAMNPFLLIRSAEDGDDPRRTDLVTQNYVCQRFGLQCTAPTR